MLNNLVEAGYADQIMISGDMGRRSALTGYGGGPGYGHILQKFIPRLKASGWDDSLVNQVFVTNPAHWLDF